MAEEKITKAIESADSSVSIETEPNDSKALKLIRQALINSKKNSSFFYELVRAVKAKDKINEEQVKHGRK